ncbi:MAG: vanadium-dependent haloperoxidase [Myxococcales bacterium]|nr:vanadium-dependent haloperoxidase [Myxococcales bacterium]
MSRLILVACFVGIVGCPKDDPDPRAWSLVADGLDEALLSVHGTAADDVWAVGADRGTGPIVLHYDGSAWRRLETGTRGELWWVHAIPGGPVYMAGANATILRYEGGTFTRMATPGVATFTVYGMWARSADEVYAVGSIAGGRDGFVWRFDGTSWSSVPLPMDTPKNAAGNVPGFFKVWGDAEHLWVVGGNGLLLERVGDGPFRAIPTGTDLTLFTVHSEGGELAAVGGAGNGVLVEGRGAETIVVSDATPTACPLLQGVCLTGDGGGWATGFRGSVYERVNDSWREVDHGLSLSLESLHAVWVDPAGGVWAAGGDVISPRLSNGALLHLGPDVGRYQPTTTMIDGGMPDTEVPAVVCPADQIDRVPSGSIARRWNEANLNAIRRAIPRPGVHARNLFHTSVAMYDAWMVYDATGDGYVLREKLTAADPDAAREEAISYAAYRVLTHRYGMENGGPISLACFDALMDRLGFDPNDTTATGDTPRAVGNRVGQAVIAAFAADGANEAENYRDQTGYEFVNPPLIVDLPGARLDEPSRWQPLNLAVAVTQNGIVAEAGVQGYIGANWGGVTPFALERSAPSAPYFDDAAPLFGDPTLVDGVVEMIAYSATLDLNDPRTIDLSPAVFGNNPLGTDDGEGHGLNPVTGEPYAPNVVPLGDFTRVIAEHWADGPASETPPGHWNTMANRVSDTAGFEHRLWGEGDVVGRLEWDVKLYFAVNGSVHDAAIAAWEQKRIHNSARPISLVRYMAQLGQSSDPSGPSYHADGLPIVPGLIEVITEASSAPGERHELLAPYVGQIAVRSWRGEPGDRATEVGGVAWMRGTEWMPYQRRTFVSPAFPGFVSGHSTFSRSAAEVLTLFTGSPYFPGGLGEYVARARDYLVFERGPSVEVRLQWATYYDAADQAGQSRRWGGIHVFHDDFSGRTIGRDVGLSAAARARAFFEGTAVD